MSNSAQRAKIIVVHKHICQIISDLGRQWMFLRPSIREQCKTIPREIFIEKQSNLRNRHKFRLPQYWFHILVEDRSQKGLQFHNQHTRKYIASTKDQRFIIHCIPAGTQCLHEFLIWYSNSLSYTGNSVTLSLIRHNTNLYYRFDFINFKTLSSSKLVFY